MESLRHNRALKYVLCWECCSPLGEVKTEILGHLLLLILMTVSCFVLLLPGLDPILRHIPGCIRSDGSVHEMCEVSAGTVAVLRVSFVYLTYFAVCFSLQLTIKKFEEVLNRLRTGLWSLKIVALSLMCYATCHIPPWTFDRIITFIISLGAIIFMVFQLYTIIRLSYFAVITLNMMAENGSKSAHRIQITLFILGAVVSVLAEAALIYYYPLCSMNIVFLVTNALIPLVACLWSGSECVRARNGHSGFVQGCLLTCFIIFYTWSAFTNNPSEECNPYFRGHGFMYAFHFTSTITAFIIYVINTNFSYVVYIDDAEDSLPSRREEGRGDVALSGKLEGGRFEYKVPVYSPLICSFIRGPMMCFIIMTVLDWSPSSAGIDNDKTNINAMWFKLVGCWLSTGFFIVTLYTPNVFGILPKRSLLNKS